MKLKNFFPAIILIGFGLYYFLGESSLLILKQYIGFPAILLIIGIAFLIQAYKGGHSDSILPGVIFTGIALQLHFSEALQSYSEIGKFLFIISVGLFLQTMKLKAGLLPVVLMFSLSLLLLFEQFLFGASGFPKFIITDTVTFSLEPLLLIVTGIVLLFFKK